MSYGAETDIVGAMKMAKGVLWHGGPNECGHRSIEFALSAVRHDGRRLAIGTIERIIKADESLEPWLLLDAAPPASMTPEAVQKRRHEFLDSLIEHFGGQEVQECLATTKSPMSALRLLNLLPQSWINRSRNE